MESVRGDSSGPSTRCWRRRGCGAGVGGGGGSRRLGAGLRGGVLACALGLERSGVEYAITPDGAHGERLGVVLEGVGWRLRALVNDRQLAAFCRIGIVAFKLIENEGDVRAILLNR